MLNLAIHYRTTEQYRAAFSLFKQVKSIQQTMFGEDSETLVYTLKNLGICMQALN